MPDKDDSNITSQEEYDTTSSAGEFSAVLEENVPATDSEVVEEPPGSVPDNEVARRKVTDGEATGSTVVVPQPETPPLTYGTSTEGVTSPPEPADEPTSADDFDPEAHQQQVEEDKEGVSVGKGIMGGGGNVLAPDDEHKDTEPAASPDDPTVQDTPELAVGETKGDR